MSRFVAGGELFDKIHSLGKFTEKQAASVIKQLLSAIVYLHHRNIVHRDLKAENILFEDTGKDGGMLLKLIDFGISSEFVAGKKMTDPLGTPYYIAPEVLKENYDEKCDVWSSGVILYILLCGYPPFNGETDDAIFASVQNGSFQFHGTVDFIEDKHWKKISNEAKTLISKMLTVDPSQRISSMEALGDIWINSCLLYSDVNQSVLDKIANFNVV